MFVKSNLKLRNVGSLLFSNEKYISKFDAMSISKIEIDNGDEFYSEDIPDMGGLKILCTDLNNILNEAYIEQQHPLETFKFEIVIFSDSVNEINKLMRFCNDRGEIPHETYLQPNLKIDSVDNSSQAEILETQLRPKLVAAYQAVSQMIDEKFTMLQHLHSLSDHYRHTTTRIAQDSGVLCAAEKVSLVTEPRFSPLLRHKLFNTAEVRNEHKFHRFFLNAEQEQELLVTLRRLWASLVLGDAMHTELAERQLSKLHHDSSRNSTEWHQQVKIGAIVVLLMWAASECFNNERSGREIWNDPTFAIFMSMGDFLLLLLMWGVSMQVWRAHGIDFVRLLELGDSELAVSKEPAQMVYAAMTNLSLLFLVVFIVFNKLVRMTQMADGHDKSLAMAHALPIGLVVFFVHRALCPFSSRKFWLHTLWRVLAAPFYQVIFRDGYIGDLLTSLVRVLVPLSHSFAYLGVSVYAWLANDMPLAASTSDHWWKDSAFFRLGLTPFLTLLPLWLRLVQCLRRSVESGKRWPHLGNALKYTSAIVVISYGTFQPRVRHSAVWVASFVFATLFQFAWDLTQDWGMVEVTFPRRQGRFGADSYVVDWVSGVHLQLREKRMLGPAWLYLLVICGNLVLRFAWTLTLLPSSPADLADFSPVFVSFMTHVGPLVAAGEILRRMVWGFFRLEFEQLETLSRQRDLQRVDEIGSIDDEESYLIGESAAGGDAQAAEEDSGSAFKKMHVLTDMEDSYFQDSPFLAPLSLDAWLEWDWSELLPRHLRECIHWMPKSLQTFEQRLRLIEAVVFACTVLYMVVCVALPAAAM